MHREHSPRIQPVEHGFSATFNGHTWREGGKNYLVLGTFEDPHFTMKAMDEFADDDYHKKKWRFAVLTLVVINLGGWKLELKVRQGDGIT